MKVSLWMVLAALALPTFPAAAQTASTSTSSTPSSRVVQCGTESSQRVLCAAGGEITSARLVRDLSSGKCGPAGSWGWTSNAVWADNGCRGDFSVSYRAAADSATRRITCGTFSSRRDECSASGVVDTVRLVEQSFFSRCRQGSNWGYGDTLVWAGNGCRGEFEVTYRRATPEPQPAPAKPLTRTVTCGKSSGELHTCTVTGYVDTVRLVRDLSGNTCRQKENWDYARTFVWAKSGCRGLFEVTVRDTLSGAPAPGRNTRTIVCGSYSNEQVTCRTEGYATEVRLTRDYTGTRCLEHTNWGHTDAFIWTKQGCRGDFEVTYRDSLPATGAKRITCGSASAVRVQCSTGGPASRVRVVRDVGSSPCREGDNWKHNTTTILAGNGCRAEFEVTFGRDTTPGMQPVAPSTRTVSCGSASGTAMSCNAFGTVATVRLQRDRSDGRCGTSGSWGLGNQSIWVAKGCYGDFELTYTSTLK